MRSAPIRVETKDRGVLKVIGRGKNACVNFHCGTRPEFNLIENSAELRLFFRQGLKRLTVRKKRRVKVCVFCQGDKTQVESTGNPKKPLRVVPCEHCQGAK